MDHIDISHIVQDFHHHVMVNRNIILSGAFGSGKSYMIEEFKRIHSDEFNTITIYPINYAISDNTDVLEYIKRDIIYQLVLQGYVSEKTDYSTLSSVIFTPDNLAKIATGLFANIPGGGLISGAIQTALEAKKRYDQEKQTVSSYLAGFDKAGSLYERDVYTEMICLGLEEGRREGKQWILIIEDLDRIDPKNIFRLLNVFGAHMDCRYITGKDVETNKFGFDKIVFVLDYWQICNIYNQYFGLEQNDSWEGYISKFLSSQPFYFKGVADVAAKLMLRFVANECGLSEKVVETIFSETYSMRTLSKMSSNGFESFIRTDHFDLPGGEKLNLDCKLTRLMFYLWQLNENVNKVKKIAEEAPKDYIELLAPMLLYKYHASKLCVNFGQPDRGHEYDDFGLMASEEETDIHSFFLVTAHEGVAKVMVIDQFAAQRLEVETVKMNCLERSLLRASIDLGEFRERFTRG